MSTAIQVENLSKQYRIGDSQGAGYSTLRESLSWAAAVPLRHLRRLGLQSKAHAAIRDRGGGGTIWALNDVSFGVQPGEVVGVIGHNGAGKSTLLKILSRITEPTTGRISVRGRLASLLEVGTGFHPELTGRENIYMNGSILGMSRREIQRQFDAIVDFSGVEGFLDTPVKRYSSGMYVRLGFAVAAHLGPEILVVDEVLAVGDYQFQKKCLGKLNGLAKSGRTVLFVSHNLAALEGLCRRGVVLEHGRIVQDGPIIDSIRSYLAKIEERSCYEVAERTDRRGMGRVRLQSIEVHNLAHDQGPLTTGCSIEVKMRIDGHSTGLQCILAIHDDHGHGIAKFNSRYRAPGDEILADAPTLMACRIDEFLLAPGRYRLDVLLLDHDGVQDGLEGAAILDVIAASVRGRETPRSRSDWKVFLPHRWIMSDNETRSDTLGTTSLCTPCPGRSHK